MNNDSKPNRLIHERSPYLQQHAYNPVDWYPWGEEAFEKARREEKPIFLSIGYSTCHWCHVMERESFENDAVAAYLNEHYVSIKLDREERPDIDAIYMTATQAMTGSGGWPMTVMMTHELKPFFCGTYFPPVPSYGKPSFKQLLERIRELWETKRDELIKSADGLTNAIKTESLAPQEGGFKAHSYDVLNAHFVRTFDKTWGGFGGAPKFPRPVQFDFLFNYYNLKGDVEAKEMAAHTLDRMALGGIFDQLGGGFHRYSVDNYWLVSHFEKMLYDQAQLVHSYLDAYQITGDAFYKQIVIRTCDFVLRELTHPEGGFYSALDADSEGEEGTFYIWTKREIDNLLGEDAKVINYISNINEDGNWEDEKNIIFYGRGTIDASKEFGKTEDEIAEILERSFEKLFAERAKRIRPHLDDKVLTSWNGLMIGAMARAGSVLQVAAYIDAAAKAAAFIKTESYDKHGTLLHRWREGEARFEATLDTYAFLIKGLLELYEATLDEAWLSFAITLQSEQDVNLYDLMNGGYFTSRDASDIIIRTKNMYDGAEPSGNSVATLNLMRLYTITAKSEYKERAEKTINLFSAQLEKYPYTMPEMLVGAMWITNPPHELVIVGEKNNEYEAMRAALAKSYSPKQVVYSPNELTNDFSRTLKPHNKKTTLYKCKHGSCELPVTSAEDIVRP
jgi:uncharacterized protein